MTDLEEAKRVLGEVKSGLARIARIEGVFQIERGLTDALAKIENMENKIKDLIADMDWRSLHNDAIILSRLKDIIPARTSDEETARMKVRWKTKSPEEPHIDFTARLEKELHKPPGEPEKKVE